MDNEKGTTIISCSHVLIGLTVLLNFTKSSVACDPPFTVIGGCDTKPPILEWDKAADFENGRKSPILILRQNGRL